MRLAFLFPPILLTEPSLTIPPSTASAVVEETSGMSASTPDLDMGVGVLSTIPLILSIFPSFYQSSVMSLRSRFL